jgi:hypothetical protein
MSSSRPLRGRLPVRLPKIIGGPFTRLGLRQFPARTLNRLNQDSSGLEDCGAAVLPFGAPHGFGPVLPKSTFRRRVQIGRS